MKINRKQCYEDMEKRFRDPWGAPERSNLLRECMNYAEEWYSEEQNYTGKSSKEQAKDLRAYIMDRIDLRDSKRSYFIPSFIWIFLASQLIQWFIKWIIERNSKDFK